MEKIFDDYKGIVIFYIIIAILTLLFINCKDNTNSNIVSNSLTNNVKVYA
jgi:hypothetical protein